MNINLITYVVCCFGLSQREYVNSQQFMYFLFGSNSNCTISLYKFLFPHEFNACKLFHPMLYCVSPSPVMTDNLTCIGWWFVSGLNCLKLSDTADEEEHLICLVSVFRSIAVLMQFKTSIMMMMMISGFTFTVLELHSFQTSQAQSSISLSNSGFFMFIRFGFRF